MKDVFNQEEKKIINTLYIAQKPLTTKNIADNSEMAWPTAKKYLENLQEKGYVVHGKFGKSVYWWLKT